MASPQFHQLQVAAVRPLTTDSVAISFALPNELVAQFQFKPGQYLTLRATVNGQDVRRSYSICSHHKHRLEVGIKRVDHGLFSTYAQGLSIGSTVQVMVPQGNFTATVGRNNKYLLLAVGSGITPCLSIIKSVLADEPDSHITLAYGNRTASTIMFRADINDLKDKHTERFNVMHILSAERQEAACFNGRLNGEKIQLLQQLGLLDVHSCDAIYLCGPQTMIEEARAVLAGLGVSGGCVRSELFTSTGAPQASKPVQTQQTDKLPQGGSDVTIVLDGAERAVQVDSSKETVLTAARRAGFDLPFSCAGGMCATCRCKVIEGETSMDLNFSLADWEIEAGYTLACQTRPGSDKVTLDFDAI
ncbi:ferredoxin reductase [Chromatiales bacterium (ex Bugula neritina AB1)]|nr:ferredoxin reductase [Chromatiales bacterium (ex Bugula neritina AB1)]